MFQEGVLERSHILKFHILERLPNFKVFFLLLWIDCIERFSWYNDGFTLFPTWLKGARKCQFPKSESFPLILVQMFCQMIIFFVFLIYFAKGSKRYQNSEITHLELVNRITNFHLIFFLVQQSNVYRIYHVQHIFVCCNLLCQAKHWVYTIKLPWSTCCLWPYHAVLGLAIYSFSSNFYYL